MILLYSFKQFNDLISDIWVRQKEEEPIAIKIVDGALSIDDSLYLYNILKQVSNVVSCEFSIKRALNFFDETRRNYVVKKFQLLFENRKTIKSDNSVLKVKTLDSLKERLSATEEKDLHLQIEQVLSLSNGIDLVDIVRDYSSIKSCLFLLEESENLFNQRVSIGIIEEIQKILDKRMQKDISDVSRGTFDNKSQSQ